MNGNYYVNIGLHITKLNTLFNIYSIVQQKVTVYAKYINLIFVRPTHVK